VKEILTEWRKFINESEYDDDEEYTEELQGWVKEYYSDAILNKIKNKLKPYKYSQEQIKNFVHGQIDKIRVVSIEDPIVNQLREDPQYEPVITPIIKHFEDNPALRVYTAKREPSDPLIIFYNPKLELNNLEFQSQAKRAINDTLAGTAGISPKVKDKFAPKETDNVLFMLKDAMQLEGMFDKKDNLNDKGKNFIEDFKNAKTAMDKAALIKAVLDIADDNLMMLFLDEFEKYPELLDNLESKVQQLAKADQGSEKEMTA